MTDLYMSESEYREHRRSIAALALENDFQATGRTLEELTATACVTENNMYRFANNSLAYADVMSDECVYGLIEKLLSVNTEVGAILIADSDWIHKILDIKADTLATILSLKSSTLALARNSGTLKNPDATQKMLAVVRSTVVNNTTPESVKADYACALCSNLLDDMEESYGVMDWLTPTIKSSQRVVDACLENPAALCALPAIASSGEYSQGKLAASFALVISQDHSHSIINTLMARSESMAKRVLDNKYLKGDVLESAKAIAAKYGYENLLVGG